MLIYSDQGAIPPTAGQFKADASRHAVHMQFMRPMAPIMVWCIDVAIVIETEDDPVEHQIFPPSPDGGYYFREFLKPREGRIYGIHYKWEQNRSAR